MAYREQAFKKYAPICAYCGFGIKSVLEVAHIDGNRENNRISNLVILCPTCHRMLDIDLISNHMIKTIRDQTRKPNWNKLLKDAGKKAALSRIQHKKQEEKERKKRSTIARKAAKKRWAKK